MFKIYKDGFGDFITSPQLGYATAEVWVLFVIVMLVTIVMLRLTRHRIYEGEGA
jgi:ABC-type sugar transport system permease subunit